MAGDEWWESDQALCLCAEENDPAAVLTSTRDCPAHGAPESTATPERRQG